MLPSAYAALLLVRLFASTLIGPVFDAPAVLVMLTLLRLGRVKLHAG